MIRFVLWGLTCLLTFTQCNPAAPAESEASKSQQPSAFETKAPAASTVRMAALIAQAFAQLDPAKSPYLNSEARINYFKRQADSGNLTTRMNGLSAYANALLDAGYTEQAITTLESLIPELKKYPNTETGQLFLTRLLAVAYLRLGEEANCINQRNPESCIVPISEKGQFTMTLGSETAMQICTDILKGQEDEETIWILNLAAMTIGRYPDGVPEKWRIPPSYFESGKEFHRFKDISQRVGIRGQSLAGGSCIEDFDHDGWLDIITSSWGDHDPLVFWKNDGQGGFINASESLELPGIFGGLNLVHADINNDGWADIFVLRGAWLFGEGKIPNSMLLNQGNGRFVDVTEQVGLLAYAPTQAAVFADFNVDGWIDLFVGNESSQAGFFKNEFYLNNGNGTFRNVFDAITVATLGCIKGCAAGDINNDGLPDLYLSNFIGDNLLLLNKGVDAQGIPQFENIASQAGVQEPTISFPTWFWDYNNDGWDDIFVSAYGDNTLAVARDYVRNAHGESLGGQPRIYRNNRNLTFTEVSLSMGINENIFTMGCNFGDLDADGYLDFYLGTGNPLFSSVVPNKMFRNNAGKSFDDVTAAGGFGQIQKGHGVAFGDLDRDGDEDLFESLGGACDGDIFDDILYENPIGQDKSWIVLQLQGTASNTMAIGARVKVTVKTGGKRRSIYRTVCTGGSFGSSSLQQEIGLGDAVSIEEIEIIWPVQARTRQVFTNVEMNKYARIVEGNDVIAYPNLPPMVFR